MKEEYGSHRVNSNKNSDLDTENNNKDGDDDNGEERRAHILMERDVMTNKYHLIQNKTVIPLTDTHF